MLDVVFKLSEVVTTRLAVPATVPAVAEVPVAVAEAALAAGAMPLATAEAPLTGPTLPLLMMEASGGHGQILGAAAPATVALAGNDLQLGGGCRCARSACCAVANLLELGTAAGPALISLAATADAIPCSAPLGRALFGSTALVLQAAWRVSLSFTEGPWVDRVCTEGGWLAEMWVNEG